MYDVAHEAKMSPSTVYHYYPNMSALILDYLDNIFDDFTILDRTKISKMFNIDVQSCSLDDDFKNNNGYHYCKSTIGFTNTFIAESNALFTSDPIDLIVLLPNSAACFLPASPATADNASPAATFIAAATPAILCLALLSFS